MGFTLSNFTKGIWRTKQMNNNQDIRALGARIVELEDQIKEYEQSFELYYDASMRGIKMWQEATGRDMVWPDKADLIVWLLEKFEARGENILANYFIDDELFGIKPIITTYFYDPAYKIKYKKDHPGYDIIPIDRHDTDEHFNIYWNRSKTGVILAKGFDAGYGNYILIGFEA